MQVKKHRLLKIVALALIMGSLLFAVQSQAHASPTAVSENAVAEVLSLQQNQQNSVTIYFFWGQSCPHCAAAKPVLEALAEENPNIQLLSFEVYNDSINRDIFFNLATAYGFEAKYVPTIMIGERYWEGFSDSIEQDIRAVINTCLAQGCVDLGAAAIAPYITPTTTSTTDVTQNTPTPTPMVTATPPITPTPTEASKEVDLPIIGKVDLSGQSVLVSTFLIAFFDGFNPCSIWVLTMLFTITLRTGSRKKILIIGFVFLFVTSLIYALFIGMIITIFNVSKQFQDIIVIIAAIVALFFGLVSLKDYFWYKEGISFTIDDKAKPGLYKRMRSVMEASSFIGLIGATIVLAVGVSMVEFGCTGTLPVIWNGLLLSQGIAESTKYWLLLLYMIVYNFIALGIFLTAVFTLKSNRLEEKHGRILKLLGGALMITLAIVMLVKPEMMNDLTSSLIVFAIAFGICGLILLLHRIILPKFGIQIGTEINDKKRKRH